MLDAYSEDPRVTRMYNFYYETIEFAYERAVEDMQHHRCSINGAVYGLRREYRSAWQSFLDGVSRVTAA